MTTPHIEHADLSELVQLSLGAFEDIQAIRKQADIWSRNDDSYTYLEALATEAMNAVHAVTAHLRRTAAHISGLT